MTGYGYGYKAGEHEAKAVGIGLPISMKHSTEVCKAIRGKDLEYAKRILDAAIDLKQAIPYRRYFEEMAHNKNVGPGRFPIKTCEQIKLILESAEANAQIKGLSTSKLFIKHISAQLGGKVFHQGRNGRKGKRAHIEVVLAEGTKSEKKQHVKKEVGKAAPTK
jgi:large subunit ribosomal protein L22